MRVFRRTNTILNSNTYILSKDNSAGVYIVDPGDSLPILEWIYSQKKVLSGIFLTHAHFDHMYGLNDLLDEFPTSCLYISSKMVDGLYCAKINTSKYHEKPYILKEGYSKNIIILGKDNWPLLWDDLNVFVLNTPGHTYDSISLFINNYLFTGDALIPGIKVYHREKMGNTADISFSLESIYNTFTDNTILLPGHGSDFLLGESKNIVDFCKNEVDNGFIEIQENKIKNLF